MLRIGIWALALATSSTAFADQVTVFLRDGSSMQGTLVAEHRPHYIDVRPEEPTPVRYRRASVHIERLDTDRARVQLQDGSQVEGRVVRAGQDWIDLLPDVARVVRIAATRIRRVEFPGRTWAVPDEIPEPTLRVPMGLILSAVGLAAVAFPLFLTDPSVNVDDCADGCFGDRALTAMIFWGVAGQLLSAGLFIALPIKRKRRRAWREMQRLTLGASASRDRGALRLRLAF